MIVDINTIKELRKITSIGIVECKKALVECGGNIAKAVDYLREKGIAKAYKKLEREAREGVVAIYLNGKKSTIIELNSETDFVARNIDFQNFALKLAYYANKYDVSDSEQLLDIVSDDSIVLKDELMNKISVIGENITLSRVDTLSVDTGIVGGYVHNSMIEGVGKSGALVALQSDSSDEKLITFAKQIAMHIVATKPEALSVDLLDSSVLDKERAIIEKQVKELGKNESVTKKIVDGRLSKFYQEVVLLEQIFVIDGNSRISDVIKSKEEELQTAIKLLDYRLFSISK